MTHQEGLCHMIIRTEGVSWETIMCSGPAIITFLNPVSYIYACKNRCLFNRFDGIYADGSLLVKAIKIFYGKKVTRRSCDMTSLVPLVFSYAVRNKKTVCFVGSKQEELDAAIEIMHAAYPGLMIVGSHNGYFENETQTEAVVSEIASKIKPDFLFIGMGIGKQEEFLVRVKSAGFQGVGFTCGGFIHQTAMGNENYYPAWVDKLNLRFIYRFFKEPHTRSRYIKAFFVFPWYILLERLRHQ